MMLLCAVADVVTTRTKLMKMMKITDVKEGMITAAAVLTKQNQILAAPGEELDRKLISRMQFYGITEIAIEDDPEAVPAISEPVDQPVQQAVTEPVQKPAPQPEPKQEPVNTMQAAHGYSTRVRMSEEFQQFTLNSARGIETLREQLEGFVYDKKDFDIEKLLKITSSLVRPGQTVIEYFDMIHNMRSSDDTIYTHSLNVAMIARIIGKWLKWSREDMDQLVIAGLLHDIGKILIPPEVLNKEGRLTDEEFALIKSHAQKGYDLIKDTNLDPRVKKAALMHHERCDGSGYPMHLQEILIEDFAMIIAIADVYDAMTATRKHRSAMCPFQVIAEFESDGLQKYKPEYILTFLRKMAVTYQNNQVVLNDGRSGKIILLNQNSLSKPLIQLNDGSCIDLAKSNLFIQSII